MPVPRKYRQPRWPPGDQHHAGAAHERRSLTGVRPSAYRYGILGGAYAPLTPENRTYPHTAARTRGPCCIKLRLKRTCKIFSVTRQTLKQRRPSRCYI